MRIIVMGFTAACLLLSGISLIAAEEKKGAVKEMLKIPAEVLKTAGSAVSDKKHPGVEAVPISKTDADGPEPRVPRDKATKEDMVKYIKELIDHDEDILNYISEIKKIEGRDGGVTYEFKGSKLEDMDKEELIKVFNRVQGEINRIQYDRLSKQLENIRRTQQAATAAQQAARAVTSPSIPRTPQPPPRAPSVPPSVPKVPTPPPTPARR